MSVKREVLVTSIESVFIDKKYRKVSSLFSALFCSIYFTARPVKRGEIRENTVVTLRAIAYIPTWQISVSFGWQQREKATELCAVNFSTLIDSID